MHCNAQILSGAKMIAPYEMDLEAEIEELAATRRVERLAAYRLIQAVSAQLKHLTGNGISSFHLEDTDPVAIALKPLSPDIVRVVRRGPDNRRVVLLHNQVTKEVVKVDLSGAASKPILSLIMDQGACGTAFGAFSGGVGCNLVHFNVLHVIYESCFVFLSPYDLVSWKELLAICVDSEAFHVCSVD